MTIKTFNTIGLVIIALTFVITTIILPMVDKVHKDLLIVEHTLRNG